MSKSSPSLAAAATLALAALPMLALAGAAHAAPPVRVQVSDINLNSAAGQRTLDERTNAAVHDFCSPSRLSGGHLAEARDCAAGVRAEVAEKAVALSRTQYASR